MQSYSGNVPDEPMRLQANAWYPNWLAGKRSGKNKFVKVDWIRHIQPRWSAAALLVTPPQIFLQHPDNP